MSPNGVTTNLLSVHEGVKNAMDLFIESQSTEDSTKETFFNYEKTHGKDV